MTSEVVVMNRMGAALAADSAVTVDVGNTSKVRNSALKVFQLSKYHPVGVMVYENASLLGVPWETIIKLFRAALGDTSLDTLEEYGDALVEFIEERKPSLFPMEVQKKYFLEALEAEYTKIDEAARSDLEDRVYYNRTESTLDLDEVEFECANIAIQDHVAFWESRADAKYFKDVDSTEWISSLSGEVNSLVLRKFEAWHTEADLVGPLQDLANLLITKDHFPAEVLSGLVVVGFGDKEHFPVLQHIEIGGVYDNELKIRPRTCERISQSNLSIVRAFAHTNMVNSFLSGVPTDVAEDLKRARRMIERMPLAAIDSIRTLDDNERKEIRDRVEAASNRQAERFIEEVLAKSDRRYDGIHQTVGSLSISELAQVASTLVNLSSFEQRLSFERETVGGPVDVAVISKGDGFIWIARKHYFQRELNEQFFGNYFRRGTPIGERDGTTENEETQAAESPET